MNDSSSISITNIYWMLAYAFRNVDKKEDKLFSSEKFENIYDLFCFMLTYDINRLIKSGLNKEYILKEDELTSLKGKIEINKSINSNLIKTGKLICSYDEYSENSLFNKIIKTAATALIKSKKIIDKNREKELKKSLLFFENVDVLNKKDINWSNIIFNRNNISYKLPLHISYLILNSLLIKGEDGKEKYSEYIDDQTLPKLYEKFILKYYDYHYKKDFKVGAPVVSWDIPSEEKIGFLPEMKTDITLQNINNGKKLIIDAKFYSKSLTSNPMFDRKTYRSNNLYQVFTYVKNEDKNNSGNILGMLLYAKTKNENIGWEEHNIGGNQIVITDLDLSDTFEKIEEKFSIIAEWFKRQ